MPRPRVVELSAKGRAELDWRVCSAGFLGRARSRRAIVKSGLDRPISIVVDASAEGMTLTVHDSGVGIAAGDHHRIFERFERAAPLGASTTLGIGLWIVRRLCGALGGSVEVESELGAGATFTVKLPRTAALLGSREESQA